MAHLFEQQPNESARAFAAFSEYLGMGAERSLAAVGQKLGKRVGLIERWSAKFDWPARVQAHTAHLAIVEREAAEALRVSKAAGEAREQQLRETEWAMHERAIAAAKRGLDASTAREKIYENLSEIARRGQVGARKDLQQPVAQRIPCGGPPCATDGFGCGSDPLNPHPAWGRPLLYLRQRDSDGGQSSPGNITVMAGCGSSISSGPQVAMSLMSLAARLSLRT